MTQSENVKEVLESFFNRKYEVVAKLRMDAFTADEFRYI